jgi:hypothetical protein
VAAAVVGMHVSEPDVDGEHDDEDEGTGPAVGTEDMDAEGPRPGLPIAMV